MELTVAICTYNPLPDSLSTVLIALQNQSLSPHDWELLIIDNKSSNHFESELDLSWHPQARIVQETRQGLTHARLRSASEAATDVLVCVDDDNVLNSRYLELALDLMQKHPKLGAIGGKAIPKWEIEPPDWFFDLGISLGCRDLGDVPIVSAFNGALPKEYPFYAPIGTGMVIRKEAYMQYTEEIRANPVRKALGRSGKSLASGEDNDMMLTLIKNGWEVGYFPQLTLNHLMPASRVSPSYLARMAEASNQSWVQVLAVHHMNPWPRIPRWTLPLRKMRSYFLHRAWASPVNRVRWKASCGLFEGRSSIT